MVPRVDYLRQDIASQLVDFIAVVVKLVNDVLTPGMDDDIESL